eukprot:SAG11_NODE_1894_length_4096_cov_3.920941_1_plen_186_part_00
MGAVPSRTARTRCCCRRTAAVAHRRLARRQVFRSRGGERRRSGQGSLSFWGSPCLNLSKLLLIAHDCPQNDSNACPPGAAARQGHLRAVAGVGRQRRRAVALAVVRRVDRAGRRRPARRHPPPAPAKKTRAVSISRSGQGSLSFWGPHCLNLYPNDCPQNDINASALLVGKGNDPTPKTENIVCL